MRTASIIAPMMEAVRTSEASIYFTKTTRRYIPEGCPLQQVLFNHFIKPVQEALKKELQSQEI
jgi:hypothetical protein